MLHRSFIHLPGIGPVTEQKFWQRGISDWDALRGADVRDDLRILLDESKEALERNDLYYFYSRLPRNETWRLLPGRIDQVAFLDIETNGLGFPPASHSTTITFYFRGQIFQEHEHNRKGLLLEKMMEEAAIFCTFFGDVFDLPFLRHEFRMPLAKPQVDLCFWLKRLGYKGGLKRVQKNFEDIPLRQSMDIDGFDAVRLWKLHTAGVMGALDTLLAYNAEDTIVLEPLLVKAFNMEIERRPGLGLQPISTGPYPSLPTRVYEEVYRLLRG